MSGLGESVVKRNEGIMVFFLEKPVFNSYFIHTFTLATEFESDAKNIPHFQILYPVNLFSLFNSSELLHICCFTF